MDKQEQPLICENCGNDYAKAIKIIVQGKEHVFDCFECAINRLAPRCGHCQTRIIGHGVDYKGEMYCCHHCASHGKVYQPTDDLPLS
jgi:hypothetical protein